MVRKLYLHLGMPKTGSTSLQAVFGRYEDERLLYVPHVDPNHSGAMFCAFCDRPEKFLAFRSQGLSRAEMARRGEAFREKLLALFTAPERKDIILSAEALPGLFSRADVRRLRDFVAPHFDEVEILAYLREPADFAAAALQQAAKGRARPFSIIRMGAGFALRFRNWEQVWPDARHTYVPFQRDAFEGGDLLSDFAARVGATLPTTAQNAEWQNTSLSAEALALLVTYRAARGSLVSTGEGLAQNRHGLETLQQIGERPFRVAPRFWWHLRALQAFDRAWAKRRMGRAFTRKALRPGVVTFRAKRDFTRLAEASLPLLQAHLGESPGTTRDPHADVLALMDRLFRSDKHSA